MSTIAISSNAARLPSAKTRLDPILSADFNALTEAIRRVMRELGLSAEAIEQLAGLGVGLEFPARVVAVHSPAGIDEPADAAEVSYDIEALRNPAIGTLTNLTPSMGRPVRADLAPRPPIIPARVGDACTLRVEGFDIESSLPVSGLWIKTEVIAFGGCTKEAPR